MTPAGLGKNGNIIQGRMTWWNIVDNLINNVWKTRTTIVDEEDGMVKFRGFKGKYRTVWKNSDIANLPDIFRLM